MLETRAPTLDDADAISALLGRCAEVDGEGWMHADEIRVWMTSPGLDPALDMRVVEREGAVVGYADVNVDGEGSRVYLDARIDPAVRDDAAVGRALLHYAEGRARERTARDGARVRAVDLAGGAAWRALLHERGFREVRRTFEMLIELGDEPPAAPPAPLGIELRSAREEDVPEVHETIQEAFADLWEFQRESLEWFVHHMGRDRSLWLVATEGEQVAGAAVCRIEQASRTGWVDTLGVRRPYRRRGIALALLVGALRAFHERRLRQVRLRVDGESTTGALQLYERAGMQVVTTSVLLDRAL